MTAILKQYYELTKPGVVALIVFTAIVGMLLAIDGQIPWLLILISSLGIGLAASSGAVLNHLIDQKNDAKMVRTQHRPLPSGRLSSRQVLTFAITLAVLGLGLLQWYVNTLTMVLTFVSLIGYALIYTVYLKPATPQNIVIGGAAGAAPPLLGWTAITGSLDPPAFVLFLIIYVWTPPHFWALAIYRRHDYAATGTPMLPVTHGVRFTALQIVLYTILLVIVTLLPWMIGMSGVFYLGGAVILGLAFLIYVIRLMRSLDDLLAMRVFGFSITYLMALFAFLLVDHYLPYNSALQPGELPLERIAGASMVTAR